MDLSLSSNNVTIELIDAVGNVKALPLGPNPAGRVDYAFDANELGLSGVYRMRVQLDQGQENQPAIYQQGKVQEVTTPLVGGTSQIDVTGVGQVAFYDVAAFAQ